MNKCAAEDCEREAIARGLCFKHYARKRRTGKLTTTRLTGDFWSKVAIGGSNECWPWKGFRRSSGHGLTSIKGVPMHTSRKAWILTNGPVKGDLHVLHKCDNAVCCNPSHLYLGTPADNVIDTFTRRPFEERGRDTRSCLLTDEQLEKMWQLRRNGATIRECSEVFAVHHTTIVRYITKVRLEKLKKLQAVRLSLQNDRKHG